MAYNYQILIEPPAGLSQIWKDKIVQLVSQGGQVNKGYIKVGLHRAKSIGLLTLDDVLISTCTLKVPTKTYRDGVFQQSKCGLFSEEFALELGYMATSPQFEGKGHCQALLNDFMPMINKSNVFATTRKPSIVHILGKLGFVVTGEPYKENLELLTFKP